MTYNLDYLVGPTTMNVIIVIARLNYPEKDMEVYELIELRDGAIFCWGES